MAKPRLDQTLLRKMARKLGRHEDAVRQGISHRATRLGVGPLAAQLVWAHKIDIAIGGSLGRVPADVRQEVREHLDSRAKAGAAPRTGRRATVPGVQKKGDGMRAAVNLLIRDPDLKRRCADTLKGSPPYDRAVNQATLVLENRLRKIANAPKAKAPDLAAIVFKSSGPVVRLSDEADEQDGYQYLARGLFAVYRNGTHHRFATMSREEAIGICSFINNLLDDVARGKRADPKPPAATPAVSGTAA